MKRSIMDIVSCDERIIQVPLKIKVEEVQGLLYICPDSDELVELDQMRDHEALLGDLFELLRIVSIHLNGIFDWNLFKNDGSLHNISTGKKDYDKAMTDCAKHLLEFSKKWGRFGIFWSNVPNDTWNIYSKNPDGSTDVASLPLELFANTSKPDNTDYRDGLPYGNTKYNDYAKHFMPPKTDSPQMFTKDFYLAYREPVRAIIFNNDFMKMLRHFIRWDLMDDFIVTPPQILTQWNGKEWVQTWRYNGLMQALSILYMHNLKKRAITVCPECGCVFSPSGGKHIYCSTNCSAAVRMRKFRQQEDERT